MNLQEKLSGLKGLVSHSRRRHKGDLTVDMISPPLGDFRHTMHVGRGGEVFGDTSFLSNHGGTGNGNNETDSISSSDNKIGAFFSRTLRHIRRGSDSRSREAAKDLSPPPPAVSPIIKNAISLPRLDVDMPNGSSPTKVLFPSAQNTPEEAKSSYGLESGFVTLPRLSRSERHQPSVSPSLNVQRGSLTDPSGAILSTCSAWVVTSEPKRNPYSDSLPSLTSLDTFCLDLGPSLMSEVFSLISSQQEEFKPREDHMADVNGFEALWCPGHVGTRTESGHAKSTAGMSQLLLKGQNELDAGEGTITSQPGKKISYSFMDEEDEIKV